jgi:hypothetical protein
MHLNASQIFYILSIYKRPHQHLSYQCVTLDWRCGKKWPAFFDETFEIMFQVLDLVAKRNGASKSEQHISPFLPFSELQVEVQNKQP